MGDGSSSQLITAGISASEGRSKDPLLMDSGSNRWTDEKHILFLNSMEQSFVNELYNEQYRSKAFLGWLSRIKKRTEPSGPYENDLKSGQLKVLRKGCWENLRFERDSSHTDIENGSFTLSANPWFQHFRSPLVMKQRDLNSSDGIGDIKFIRPAAKMASERLDEEATNSKHICHQDSIGSSTEVSDQNFIADELIVGKRSSGICRKRRSGTALVHGPIDDQVIPCRKALITTSSDENQACRHPTNAGSGAKISEAITGIVTAETEASPCKNQEIDGWNFGNVN
ncbi:hypothetical protein OPV22_026728 [Ensete ventricosum]|uniref:Uncharacterized protein n=1 Tax=Ensete ventricosum TaxID=4639 RepID=A0AAV8P3H0_ENSVE|nr:hypothetical protein OPV22_026728 [Ensete ventricosum]